MRVLSVGNSFSQDAHKYLHRLSKAHGTDIQTVNLYIGGCSLSMHCENLLTRSPKYDLEINGGEAVCKISLTDALSDGEYDVVTLQQVSGLSGIFESYSPYLEKLAETVRHYQPKAEIMFHQTWSYETDSAHPDFKNYGDNQKRMFREIKKASEAASRLIGAELIKTGTAVQKLRDSVPEFDYANGGISLCRDGFHLTYDYGRFLAAAVWFKALTGKSIAIKEFENFDSVLLHKIINTVNG